jgi:DNA-binding transcriptional ArsR family regulator
MKQCTPTEALALAVAEPGSRVRRIDSDNRGHPRTDRLVDALASGRAFAVRVRHEIVAVDFDCDTAAGDARQFAGYCRAHELDPVVLASGTADHFHVFVRVDDEATRRLMVKEARRLHGDVRQAHNLIRPPLSPHRRGGQSELLDPRDPLDAIDALLGRLDHIAPRLHRLLLFGDLGHEYRSASEMMQAITTGAVHAGWTEAQLLDAFLDPANLGGARVRERDVTERRGADGYVATCWNKAVQFVARAQLAEIQAAVDAAPWPGRSGGTDRAVMQAYVNIAQRANTITPDASQRRLADEAGVSAKTVERTQPRLVEGGWIVVKRPGYRTEAARWGFGPSAQGVGTYTATSTQGGRDVCADTMRAVAHDLWRFCGLGKGCQQTWTALASTPATIAQLVERTGYTRPTINRHVACLQDHDIVTRDDDHRYRVVDRFDLDALAADLDVAGIGDRQREHHRRQRDLYAKYLEHDRFTLHCRQWRPSPRLRRALRHMVRRTR